MTTKKTLSFVLAFLVMGCLAYKPALRTWHRAPVEVYVEGWRMNEGEVVAQIRFENNTPDSFQYHFLLEPPYLVKHLTGVVAPSDKPIVCVTGIIPRMPYGTLTPGEAISVSIPAWWLNATINRPGLYITDTTGERAVWGEEFKVPGWVPFFKRKTAVIHP